MKKSLFLLCLFFCTHESLVAQNIKFEKTYSKYANTYDSFDKILRDKDKNTYTLGNVIDTLGIYRICLYKFNDTGIKVDSFFYSHQNQFTTYSNKFKIDAFGNIYILGDYNKLGKFNTITLKLDKNFNVIWINEYDNNLNDFSVDILLDSDNVYICGSSEGLNTSYDAFIIKYDKDGNAKKTIRYNKSDNKNELTAVLKSDKKGGYYLFGDQVLKNDSTHLFLNHYDSSGALIFNKIYKSLENRNQYSQELHLTNDNLYLTSYSFKDANRDYKIEVLKLDMLGNIIWQKLFSKLNKKENVSFQSIITINEDLILSGFARNRIDSFGSYTISVNKDGNKNWELFTPLDSNIYFIAKVVLQFDQDSNIQSIINWTNFQNINTSSLMKFSLAGKLINLTNYKHNNYQHVMLNDFVIDTDNEAIICGNVSSSISQLNTYDALLLRFNKLTNATQTLKSHSSVILYPNPAKDYINLQSQNPQILNIKIYDLTGKTVKMIEENASQMDISDLKQGMYYVHIVSKEGSQTLKFVKE